ncbi:MAG: hypothetical protein GEU75_14940 [Dehalococcoidia bacterium]|nr:hypothetical protein [Dehalococcoidia bacterium]
MAMRSLRALLLAPLLVAGLAVGCGDDGDEGEDGHMAGGHMAEAGVVSPKPADATQVNVTLREWAVAPAQPTMKAGKVYFLVENIGPEHPHELVIIRTNLGPLELPFKDNKVPEDQVDILDEIEEFAPHSSASLTLELTPGRYLLVCNITEEDPQIGSHYKKGMVAAFTAE